MPKLVIISGKGMVKILKSIGFELIRVRGSHHFLENKEDGSVTTVPVHNGEDLSIGMIKDILSDVDVSKEEYEKLRKKRKK
jgi:predicted RNA binding protein YcfA (HicA-like mRNA interferase family)